MKNQALFSSKDKTKKLKCCLLQFLFCALRVKLQTNKYILCSLTEAYTISENGHSIQMSELVHVLLFLNS